MRVLLFAKGFIYIRYVHEYAGLISEIKLDAQKKSK